MSALPGARADGRSGRRTVRTNGQADGRTDWRADSQVNGLTGGRMAGLVDGLPGGQDKEHMRMILTSTACRDEVAEVCAAAYSAGGVYRRAQYPVRHLAGRTDSE